MRMKPMPGRANQDELDKIVQLKINRHDKYKELYTLVQIERSTRAKIEGLMIELGLKIDCDYGYTPTSPSERVSAASSKKTNDSEDGTKSDSSTVDGTAAPSTRRYKVAH